MCNRPGIRTYWDIDGESDKPTKSPGTMSRHSAEKKVLRRKFLGLESIKMSQDQYIEITLIKKVRHRSVKVPRGGAHFMAQCYCLSFTRND